MLSPFLFEPAGQPPPMILRTQPSFAVEKLQAVAAAAPPRLAPGDILFLPDVDLVELTADDGRPLGIDAIVRFLESRAPASPSEVIKCVSQLAAMYGSSDVRRHRWFAAAWTR